MHDAFHVQIADCYNQLGRIKLDGLLVEALLGLKDFVKLATTNKWHDEVQA